MILDLMLTLFGLIFFLDTDYAESWSVVKLGGDQFSISLTALIVLIYLMVGAFVLTKWYFLNKVIGGGRRHEIY